LTEHREYRHNPAHRPWYRRAWFTWVVVIVIAAAFIGILVYPVAAMDDQSYCTSCKAMQPAAKTLAQSAHKGIDCNACHMPAGTVASARWKLGEAKNIWADYLGMPTSNQMGSAPSDANCESCHPVSDIPNESGTVRMNHELHLKLRNLDCIDCHDTVSHKLPGQQSGVSMITCSMCHRSEGTAPSDCGFCHTVPPKSDHAPNFMKDHGKEALANPDECLRCHHDKQKFCDACHDYPPPSHYSGQWRYTHGKSAAKDPANCEACHDESYCAQCHQVNHPEHWLDSHGPIAAKGPSACLVCHPQSMCDECHAKEGVEVTR
jgi:nitrate/TMAO reductase-like tetraheme cytochrome c subunit